MIADLSPYPRMQDPGVDWLGKVPAHWDVLPNRALFSEVDERDYPEEQMLSVTITKGVIRQRALLADSSKKDSSNQDKSAYKLVLLGDIVYNKMRAWQGAIGVSDHRGIVSPAYVVERPYDGISSRYFHYLLRIPTFAKEAERWSYGIASDMWSLRPEHFKMIYGCLPPLPEQHAIVRFLDHTNHNIRRYIDAKQRLIGLLEEQRREIIQQAVTRGLNPDVSLKDSGVGWLGEVPEHWKVMGLKYLSRCIQNGITPPTAEPRYYENGTIPWYGPSSCRYQEKVDSPVRHLTVDAFREGKARLISKPALLVVVIGATAGRMALLMRDGSTNQQITSFELNTTLVNPLFILRQLRNAEHWLHATASTATIPILDTGVVSRLSVAFPSLSEQHVIVEYFDKATTSIDTAIERTRRQIELMEEYRTRLISDVVTGKVDVREAAAQLPEQPEGENGQ